MRDGRLLISYHSQQAHLDGVVPLPLHAEEMWMDHRDILLRPADVYFGSITFD